MIEDASLLMLGNLAKEKSILSAEQLNSALDEQRKSHVLLGEILVKRKLISRNQLKVLLDMHNLKVFYYDAIKFGFLAIVNKFVTEEQIRRVLDQQKHSNSKVLIGDMLIKENLITADERDSILKVQKRLTSKQEAQAQTFINCPFCEQSYSIMDPDRYRKIRCRHCHLVFEVGVVKNKIEDQLEFSMQEYEEKVVPKKKNNSDLHRLSSFLLDHNIGAGISLGSKGELGSKGANRKYVFGNELARGGMGAIVETLDTDIKRDVVTKILLRNDSKESILKFIEEAQITGQLEHPNIVPVYDLGINDEGFVYFTMKRVRGETLLHIIEKIHKKDSNYLIKYPLDVLIEILLKVCDGVAFAHQKGVIHRDLKPENIMVGEFGEVLTMDWGLAKVLGKRQANEEIESLDVALKTIRNDKGKAKTLEGTIAGTPEYMSPEQAKGHIDQLTICADVYSLGAVLFTMLECRLPVEGKTPQETLQKVAKGDLNEFQSDVPPELKAIVYKAMEYKPQDRYHTVNELKEDLINYLRGYSVSAKEDTYFEVSVKFVRRNLFLSVGAGFLFLVMFVAMVIVLLMINKNANTETRNREAQKTLADLQTAGVLQKQKEAPEVLNSAVALIKEGKYAIAEDKIKTVINDSPDLPDAYYFKGVLECSREEYDKALESFKVYENKFVYGIKSHYPAVHVNGLMKSLYRIRDIGLNTIDIHEIKVFFESNKLPLLALATNNKMEQLFIRYENKVKAISPETKVEFRDGGVVFSLEKIKNKEKLGELLSVPIIEINLENSNLNDISFLNKIFLKKLVLNACFLKDYQQISKFNGLEWVELADSNVTDISFLKGLKLKCVNLANTSVEDLSPIENQPVVSLDITGLPIKNILQLSKMPLVVLRMGNTRVFNLEPLKGKKLEWLSIWQTGIESLKDIKGQPIVHLDIENSLVKDLSDLLGGKLERLYLDGNIIDDKNIIVLNKLQLKVLSIRAFKEQSFKGIIENIPVVKLSSGALTEINSLNFTKIIELDLSQCTHLQNIKGVSSMVSLKKIYLPAGIKNYMPLSSLPNLDEVVTPELGPQSKSTFFLTHKAP